MIDGAVFTVVDLMLYERQAMLADAVGRVFPVKLHEIDRICG